MLRFMASVAFVTVSLWISTAAADSERNMNMIVEKVEAQILPGIQFQDATKILDDLTIEYSFIPVEDLMMLSQYRSSISDSDKTKGMIIGIVRSDNADHLIQKSMKIYIEIDLDNKVSNVEIDPIYTGP